MKKILFLLVAVILSINCFAQFNVYHPFPDSNAVWGEDSLNASCGGGMQIWGYNFVVKGDTVVNSLTYHKVYQNEGYWYNSCFTNPYTTWNYSNNFFGAYREDTMKHIYACCTSYLGSHDSLLYDFNLKVGDTLKQFTIHTGLPYELPYTIHSIDSVMVGGTYRKRFNLASDTQSVNISILEGIGSTEGLFDFLENPSEIMSTLNCFSQNGKTIWSLQPNDTCGLYYLGVADIKKQVDSITTYPNPSSGTFTIQSSVIGDQWTVEVYNELGQQVYIKTIPHSSSFPVNLSNQSDGIYLYRIITEAGSLIGNGKLIIQK